ncbi:MAG: hypothetical protein Q9162_005827 [Coniocarpon cinnabarinum]
MTTPRAIVIPALKKHTATLICIHGLGDSGAGWTFLAENWRRRGKFEEVAFVFPSAPTIPITANMGMQMPGWYDIINFDTLKRSDDEPGILKSQKYIHSLINQQIADGIPPSRIILGGFSQGGAMSLFSGPTFRERLAGVFGLSSYQLLTEKFGNLVGETYGEAGEGKRDVKKEKIFMGHGIDDPLVKCEWGQMTMEGLKEKGFEVEWHTYPDTVHAVDPKEIDDLEAWVTKRLEETKEEKL